MGNRLRVIENTDASRRTCLPLEGDMGGHGDTLGLVKGHGNAPGDTAGRTLGTPRAHLHGLSELHVVDKEGDKVPGGYGPHGHQLCPTEEEPQLQGQR